MQETQKTLVYIERKEFSSIQVQFSNPDLSDLRIEATVRTSWIDENNIIIRVIQHNNPIIVDALTSELLPAIQQIQTYLNEKLDEIIV